MRINCFVMLSKSYDSSRKYLFSAFLTISSNIHDRYNIKSLALSLFLFYLFFQKKDTIDNTKEYQYVYSWEIHKTKAMRVLTAVNSSIDPLPRTEHPLRISVRYDKGSTNWHIPFR